eukprot:6177985-Pleurochrysis_carterae.AAC.8
MSASSALVCVTTASKSRTAASDTQAHSCASIERSASCTPYIAFRMEAKGGVFTCTRRQHKSIKLNCPVARLNIVVTVTRKLLECISEAAHVRGAERIHSALEQLRQQQRFIRPLGKSTDLRRPRARSALAVLPGSAHATQVRKVDMTVRTLLKPWRARDAYYPSRAPKKYFELRRA